MHAPHGSSASASAASTSSGTNGPSTSSKKHRYSSRSNSISTASVVTVKESMPQEHRRRLSTTVEPPERPTGGLSNLHRWSHSTDSSVSSVNAGRSRASSGAVLEARAFSPQKKSRTIVDHSPRPSPHRRQTSSRPGSRRRHSPASSPEEQRRPLRPELGIPLSGLPPLHTTPALTDPNDTESPSTIPVATPSTQSSYGQDYFGEDDVSPRNKAKSKKPVMIRSHTASPSTTTVHRPQTVGGAEMQKKDGAEMKEVDHLRSRFYEPQEPTSTRPSTTDEDGRRRRSRTREKSEKEKKAMLSKALQKANTAVLLDNAANFEGALEAYTDACRLLQQVMDRSSGEEDKRKLDSIRITYTNRVEELKQMEAAQPEPSNEKSLPVRPMSDESLTMSLGSARSPTIDAYVTTTPEVGTPVAAQAISAPKISPPHKDRDSFFSGTVRAVESSMQREHSAHYEPRVPESTQARSLIPSPVVEDRSFDTADLSTSMLHDAPALSERKHIGITPPHVDGLHIPPTNNHYMPAPLSPRRPSFPELKLQPELDSAEEWQEVELPILTQESNVEDSNASGSWLDPIDESESECSSVHSVSSQQGLRRRHIRGTSGDTDPDFDAAFDAAMETAYNEGLEPDLEGCRKLEPSPARHAPQESLNIPSSDIKEILSPTNSWHPGATLDDDDDLDDEEEERLLDEITSDYAQSFNFDLATKSALPRQSDSSGYSRSTWQSSQVSDRTTAGTSLSTVAEDEIPPPGPKNAFAASASLNDVLAQPPPPPSMPPPQGSLPKPPTASRNRDSGVRSRRLSGQNSKQLKIETSAAQPDFRQRASTLHHSASPVKEEIEEQEELDRQFRFGSALQPTDSDVQHERILTSPPSLDMLSVSSDASRPLTATTVTTEQRRSLDESPSELKLLKPILTKKNKSSVSLQERTVIIASPPDHIVQSAATPMSTTFSTFAAKRHIEAPLTSQRANFPSFGSTVSDSLPGGMYLFDTSLAATQYPSSPSSPEVQPISLEPCPESSLLRPFWLMRAMASTLTQPKGGFLTTRLFVPREAWQTRGVKLKSVEEKVSSCDLLTAALGRLKGVDTYDADALMDELQNFEEVMERVQVTLVKKLGSEVGIGGLAGIFKDAAAVTSTSGAQPADATTSGAEKTRSKEGKGYLTSWRKLRSKSSGTPITNSQSSRVVHKTAERDLPTMPSVPMTSYVPVERRGQKKDAKNLVFEGPNRDYMGSLARLFEAVQVLDQIARQVEDPGLKGSSPTHVGLELSIRHAAEFFGFYVCRFVLADIGLLVEKFVKRGTEWVLA